MDNSLVITIFTYKKVFLCYYSFDIHKDFVNFESKTVLEGKKDDFIMLDYFYVGC